MKKKMKNLAYTLAAISGICFVQGLIILTPRKGMVTNRQTKGDCINNRTYFKH